MNSKRKELGKQTTSSMGPDFHFIWVSGAELIFMAEIQYAMSAFSEYSLSTRHGSVNLLRCSENSSKKIGEILALFNSHSNWRSAVN